MLLGVFFRLLVAQRQFVEFGVREAVRALFFQQLSWHQFVICACDVLLFLVGFFEAGRCFGGRFGVEVGFAEVV